MVSLDVTPAHEAALRAALATALTHGKGVVHVLSDLDGLRDAMLAGTPTAGHRHACRCFPPSAPARCAAPAMPSWTRACSPTTANTAGARTAWAPACALTKEQRKVFDDSVRDDDNKGREQTFAEAEVEDLHDAACPTCQGTRLNATARAVRFGAELLHNGRLGVAITGHCPPERDRRAPVGADAAGGRAA